MKTRLIITFLLLWNVKTFIGQSIIINGGTGIDNIIIGYSTRPDVIKTFGTNCDTVLQSYIDPDQENYTGTGRLKKSDQLIYKSLGISFICDDDVEIISGIQLSEPFKGITQNGLKLELGKTTFNDIFSNKNLDSLKISTTGASIYWSVLLDSNLFYVIRDTAGRFLHLNDPGWFKNFNQTLPFVSAQKIKYVGIGHSFGNRYWRDNKDSLDCVLTIPLYSPISEKHLNCLKRKIETLADWFIIMAPQILQKEGLWKEYHPNHNIASIGNYKADIKVGLFKYYDLNGKLIKTTDYGFPIQNSNAIIIGFLILFGVILIVFLRKRKKKRNQAS